MVGALRDVGPKRRLSYKNDARFRFGAERRSVVLTDRGSLGEDHRTIADERDPVLGDELDGPGEDAALDVTPQ